MKVLVDIPDTKQSDAFLKRAQSLSYVQKAQRITTSEAELLAEIIQIKRAHRMAEQLKAGKLKTRPARALLNEL